MLEDFPFVELDIKKLKGQGVKKFRVRIGKYRILFVLENGTIRIADVDIRDKAYD